MEEWQAIEQRYYEDTVNRPVWTSIRPDIYLAPLLCFGRTCGRVGPDKQVQVCEREAGREEIRRVYGLPYLDHKQTVVQVINRRLAPLMVKPMISEEQTPV